MNECVGEITNLYNGKLTLELIDPLNNQVTSKVEVNNAVMDFNNDQWKQLQKITWFDSCKDGLNGGYVARLKPFFGNSDLLLTTDSSTPDSTDAYINGTVLVATPKYNNSSLSQRTDNRARFVFEYGPAEANGTFQSICWGEGTSIVSGVTGTTVPAARANTQHEFIKTVGHMSNSVPSIHSDGYVYHFYTDGNAVTNVTYFAKTNIETGIRTNLFINSTMSGYRVLVHGSNYIFYSTGYSGISFYVYNAAGQYLVRSGTGPYTYSFASTGTAYNFDVSLPWNGNYSSTTSLLSDGDRLYAIPHTPLSGSSSSIIKISGPSSSGWGNLATFAQLTLDSFSGLNYSSAQKVTSYLDGGSIWLYYKDLYSSSTERIIARKYTPSYGPVSQSLVFNSTTNGTSISAGQFNFNTTYTNANTLFINSSFALSLSAGSVITFSSGAQFTITSNPAQYSGSIYYMSVSYISGSTTFTNGSSYSLASNAWSATTDQTETRDRTIVYGEATNNLFTWPISTTNPYYNTGIQPTKSYIGSFSMKSNISGYDVLDVTAENSYTSNGLTYYPMRLMGAKWFRPDIVSTRAVLPTPFTKTSDKTLRITYDINFV